MKRVFTIISVVFLFLSSYSQKQSSTLNLNNQQNINEVGLIEKASDQFFSQAKRASLLTFNNSVVHVKRKDTLNLNLFHDKTYKAVVLNNKTNVNGTVSIVSKLIDYSYAYCFISIDDGKALVSIDIPELSQKYVSRTDAHNQYIFLLDNNNLDILEGAPSLIPLGTDTQKIYDTLTVPMKKNNQIVPPKHFDTTTQAMYSKLGVNDTARIDIMVVYTPAAQTWANANEGNINNTIADFMAKCNLVSDNSNLLIDFNLVHSALVSYVEVDPVTDLTRLTTPSDGYMDVVHSLRDQYGADLVVLLSFENQVGGVGWQLDDRYGMPAYGFSITRVQQASYTYTGIHEIGHNMGAHHHKQQNFQPGPTNWFNWSQNNWSAGWRWTGSDNNYYCSVMTYESGAYFSDGITHTKVPCFSNPNISYMSVPTGHSVNGDNARTLREVKHYIAQYRNVPGSLPPNNDCAGAIELTVYGSTCTTPTTGDVAGATQSLPAITCNSYTGSANDDVWFKFVAQSTEHTITVVGSAGFDAVVDLREGACPGTNIDCADSTISGGTEVINATGLTVGQTYYVRVYHYGTSPSTTDFTICITTPAGGTVPPNNDCAGAIELTVYGSTCTTPTTGDVAGATQSLPAIYCNGTTGTANDDVWYKFVAQSTEHTITVVGSAGFDAVVDLREGACPGTTIDCADETVNGGTEVINATGLTVGQTYYVRVYNWSSSMPSTTDFTICITTPSGGTVPPNNDCAGAIELTVYGSTCTTPTTGDVAGATQSLPAIYCNGTTGTANDDVWYKFVAQSTEHTITVVGSADFDAVVDLRSGTCPGTTIDCADDTFIGGTEVINATGLTVGDTYYVRVYDFHHIAPSTTTFTICITTPPPVNNYCSGAIDLTVHSGTTCTNPVTGSVAGATNSGVPLDCGGISSGAKDVWYKFTATHTSHIITVEGSADFDAVVDLRAGVCPGTNIDCADDTYQGGTEVINATGLTVGQTYYVRVYHWGFSIPKTTDFTICITTPAAGGCETPGPPTNLSVTPSQTGAQFSWDVPTNPPGSPTIVYYWVISDQATPSWSNYIARCGDAGGFNGNTDGTGSCAAPAGMPATLTPSTQYYLHMYASTSCDFTQSPWTTESFTTLSSIVPPNNDCSGAIELTVYGSTCITPTTGDVAGATQSLPAITCNGLIGTANNDVWYKFVAQSTEHTITVVGSAEFDAVVDFRSGACPGINIDCADTTLDGGTEVINATGLTVGDTYYVRVYDFYSIAPPTTTFTICVTTPQTGAEPVADFTASTTTITEGGTVDFTDLSTNNPTSWSWEFAVGQPTGTSVPAISSLQNETVQYNDPGTYTVRLTASNSFGSDTEEKVAYIVVNPAVSPLDVTASAQQTTICEGTQTQLNATPSGGSGSYTYEWSSTPIGFSSTSQNPTVAPTTTTTYTVEVDDGSQTATASVVVTVDPLPYTPGSISGSAIVCKGTTNVSYHIPSISNATGYVWMVPSGVTIISGQNTNNIVVNYGINAVSSDILVAGTNSCGTGPTTSLTITVHDAPLADAGTSQTIAYGGTTTLSGSATGGSGNYSYSWEPASLLANANVQNPTTLVLTSTQVFTLTVTDNVTGCEGKANVQIMISGGPLSVTASASATTICEGTQTQLNATPSGGSGSYTYEWSSSPSGFTSTSQTPTVSPTTTTTYTVEVNDGSHTATASVVVNVDPLPSTPGSISGSAIVCKGTTNVSYYVSSISNATGYIWTVPSGATITSGQNTNNIVVNYGSNAVSGYITVAGTNSCGTGPATPLTITVHNAPLADAGTSQTIASGGTATLSGSATGGSGNYSYSWEPASLLANANVQNPTTLTLTSSQVFTLTVTDDVTGCEGIANVQIMISGGTLSVAASASATTICEGAQTQLNATPNGGSGTYTYEWSSNPAGFSSTSQNPTAAPTTTTIYTVEVDDGSQTATASVVVTVDPLPSTPGSISGSAIVCKGTTNVSYYIPSISNATGYVWIVPSGATITSGQNSNNIVVNYGTNAVSGDITVAGTNSCGIGPTTALAITVHGAPLADAGTSQTIASGGTATLSGSATGGSGNYSYSWEPASLLANANVQNPTTLTLTSSQVFTLTVTDDVTGCEGIANVQIMISGGTLSVTASASATTICEGDNVTLGALPSGGTGSNTFTWTSSPAGFNSTSQNPTATPTVTTQYTVTVDDGSQTVSASVTVNVNPLPDTPGSITGTPSVCQNSSGISYSVTSVNNATAYTWALPPGAAIAAGNNTNSILVNFGSTATSGNISVVATNACGSSNASPNYSVTVDALPAAAGTISGPSVVNQGQTNVSYILPVINNATNYIWTLPHGVNIVSGFNTNSIVVDISSAATTGVISVYGSNACGDGPVSPAFPISILTNIEESENFEIAIYPNPTNGLVYIETGNNLHENLHLKLYNTIGELVLSQQLEKTGRHTIDVSILANGLYYLNISGNTVNKVEKLIIQK